MSAENNEKSQSWCWQPWALPIVVALAAALSVANPARAQAPEPGGNRAYLADELMVQFDHQAVPAPADPAALTPAQFEAFNARLRERAGQLAVARGWTLLDTLAVLRVALFRLPPGVDPVKTAGSLSGHPGIVAVEPNYLGRQAGTRPPNDSFSGYFAQDEHFRLLGAERGWDTIPLDFKVRVAVLDSGLVYEHDDAPLHVMAAGGPRNQDRDFVRPGSSPNYFPGCNGTWYPRTWDMTGYDGDASQPMSLDWHPIAAPVCVRASAIGSHGTAVTGMIAAAWADVPSQPDGTGLIGRAELGPDNSRVEIIPVQVIDAAGDFTHFDLAQGLVYAAGLPASNGVGGTVSMPRADIANMSLSTYNLSVTLFMAAQMAHAQGLLMVAAAGNENQAGVSYPAAFPEVIAVSALDDDELRWVEDATEGSNYGPEIEFTAHGAGAYVATWDYSACPFVAGVSCTAAFGGASHYARWWGTSFAAPQVTAMAALYKAHDDSLTAGQLRQMLRRNAVDWGAPGQDDEYGFGVVQTAPGSGVTLVNNRTPARVFLIDADTGERVLSTDAVGGYYNFPLVPVGSYHLLAAVDDDGDGVFGETGEAIGAQGGTPQSPAIYGVTLPAPVQGYVNSLGFTLDWPDQEPEPANNDPATPASLFLGFYAEVSHDSPGDVDWFEVRIPDAGAYRFWTEGRNTVNCREDLNDMTPALALFDDSGALVAEDIGSTLGSRRCAEIDAVLTAGTYLLRLESATGTTPVGRRTIVHADREAP